MDKTSMNNSMQFLDYLDAFFVEYLVIHHENRFRLDLKYKLKFSCFPVIVKTISLSILIEVRKY